MAKHYRRHFSKKRALLWISCIFLVRFMLYSPNLNDNEDSYYPISLNESWEQADDRLSEYVRQHVLLPPPRKTYTAASDDAAKVSQFGVEDVLDILFQGKTHGVFVEAGAANGTYLSNTYYLEKRYNWTGLLVEGNPEANTVLLNHRRNAWLAPVLISINAYPSKVLISKNGVSSYIQPREDVVRTYVCDNGWLYNVSNEDIANISKSRPDCIAYDNRQYVLAVPLYTLLKSSGMTHVDFFSLDVEGVEINIINTIPFDKVNIKVLLIESNHLHADQLLHIMSSKGYLNVHKVGVYDIRTKLPIDTLFVKEDAVQEMGPLQFLTNSTFSTF